MAKRGRSGDPAKRRYGRDVVERWRQSGQSVRAFCRSGGVKEAAFYWWRQRLAQRYPRQGVHRHKQGSGPQGKPADVRTSPAGPERRGAARFLPVPVIMDQAGQSSSGVEIHWDNGRSVRLHRRFDRQTLADVLAVRVVLASHVLHTDDTSVKVRDAWRKLKYTGRFWPYVGDPLHPLTVFDYTTTHQRDGPAAFLKDYRGYLQADAFNGYDGICLGRRNWLFCGSDRGGRAAAIHFSLLASCKRHGHDPRVYLRDVLTRLPAMLPGASEEELLALLPHRWHPA